jgi:hypothetical protein
MGGLLIFQKRDEHRCKTIDGIGVLALGSGEILGWESKKSAVCHGMAIDKK